VYETVKLARLPCGALCDGGEIETTGEALTLGGNATAIDSIMRTTSSFDLADINSSSESNHGLKLVF
jgi:hypothetical protein